MNLVMDDAAAILRCWQGPEVRAVLARLLGEDVTGVDLERSHFPARRLVQLNLLAKLRLGSPVPFLAEYCPDDPSGHAQQVLASLRKRRNGQTTGLDAGAIAVAGGAGLVLRRPGLDERLPGLRLLYDPDFARAAVETATGQDPGTVSVQLVAHRLGKRAVLRVTSAKGVIYARLRAIKSGEGAIRFARHHALWVALADGVGLRIPEPLGELPDLGVSFVAVLPGTPPDFGSSDCAAIASAFQTLQSLKPEGLPRHTGADEALLLTGWLNRCRLWRPEIARLVAPGLERTMRALAESETKLSLCHRDLHEKQILITGGVAGLLDFDTLCLSDPALDAGNLLAHLFLAGHDEGSLRTVLDARGLGLWRSAALFRLAMIYAVTSTPDAVLHRLITEANRDADY